MEEKQIIQAELNGLSELVAGIPRNPTYCAPEGYFEEIPAIMAAAVRPEEEIPSWKNMPAQMPQQVPDGYFAALPDAILNKAKAGEKQSGGRLLQFSSRFRWLAAACVATLVAIAAWQFMGTNGNSIPAEPSVALNKVSDEELVKYADALIPAEISAKGTTDASAAISEQDIQAMLTDYSTEELEKYVKEQHLKEGLLN